MILGIAFRLRLARYIGYDLTSLRCVASLIQSHISHNPYDSTRSISLPFVLLDNSTCFQLTQTHSLAEFNVRNTLHSSESECTPLFCSFVRTFVVWNL